MKKGSAWPIHLGVLYFVIICGITLFLAMGLYNHGVILDRIAAMKARGEPTTPEELNAYYAEPVGQNAADLYQQAFDAQQKVAQNFPDLEHPELPRPGTELSQESLELMATYLDAQADMIALLMEAATIEESRYPLNFPQTTVPSHYAAVRSLSRLLNMQAYVQAHSGNAEDAAEILVANAALIGTFTSEPTIIAHAIQSNLSIALTKVIARTVTMTEFTPLQLAKIETAFRACYETDSLRRSLIGERCSILPILSQPNLITLPFTSDKERLLDIYDDILGAIELEPLQFAEKLKSFQQAYGPEPPRTSIRILTAVLTPALTGWAYEHLRVLIYQDLVTLLCAIESARLETETLPENLDDLQRANGSPLPMDPYGNGPYHYLPEGTGYVVYSLGPDRRDNSGSKLNGTPGSPRTDNIALRITHNK